MLVSYCGIKQGRVRIKKGRKRGRESGRGEGKNENDGDMREGLRSGSVLASDRVQHV